MKITRGKLIALAVVALVTAAAALAMRPKPLEVDTALVARVPLESTIDADGQTRVRQRYVIVAPVAGRIERLGWLEGDRVKAGQVVARIAPLPIDDQYLMQARARVDGASALALEAAAQVRISDASLEQRRRELSRAHRLGEVGGMAPREVEESELALRAAEETARAAAQRARAAEADVRQARAALIGRTGATAGVVAVHAPSSGRVLRLTERSERIVEAGSPLMEIGDPASLEVVVDVLSSDGAMIHPGDVVRLRQWAAGNGEGPAELTGCVRGVEPAGFRKVSALGVEEQRVNVIVDVESAPPALGDGFRVDAHIVLWSAPSVLAVPVSALVRAAADSGSAAWRVFVVRDGRAQYRDVRIGHLGSGAAEVLDGLKSGEVVVVFPSDRVAPGVRVISDRH